MIRWLALVRSAAVAVLAAAGRMFASPGGTRNAGSARRCAAAPLWLFLACFFAQGACTCGPSGLPARRDEPLACVPQHATRVTVLPGASAVETVSAGELAGSFSLSSTGEALFVVPLTAPPGRAGLQPELAISYDSGRGEGALGAGFSLRGASAITRCAKTPDQDGEIRGVQYDAGDKLCLDGLPLVLVDEAPGRLEYRTVPDAFAKVIGHEPGAEGTPRWFEVKAPSGLVTEYGTSHGTRPRGPGGVARARLAATVRDGRGNALDYGYCFAEDANYTAEYALDEIRYTRFEGEGASALEASRAVKLVYGTKDPAGIRTVYSGGMALQASLRLDEIHMVGPGERLVRRYSMGYALDEATSRTLLIQVEECAGDGVCKPATRFDYQRAEPGFRDRTTSVPVPTALAASPMLLDVDGDGLDDFVIPDVHPALSTPKSPLTQWLVAHNEGASGSAEVFGPVELAHSQDILVADPSGPADPALLQPEIGTAIDYDQDGRKDILLHDVHGMRLTWRVLLARPDGSFEVHDTGLPRPFPLGPPPVAAALTSRGGSMHLADVDGDHVPDLIQCEDHDTGLGGDPSKPVWKVHRWRPAKDGAPFGFDAWGETIEPLDAVRCDIALVTVDLDADGKVDLVVQPLDVGADGSERPGAMYDVLTRRGDGSWEANETELPVVPAGGRVVFLDVSGDGLPDAVEAGFGDRALYTYLNTGVGFAPPVFSLGTRGLGDQDTYFRLAAILDYDGDGRQDLLMPVPPATLPGQSSTLPAWAILRAKAGLVDEGTFGLVDPHIPFEAALGEAITLADPRGPRIGDLNGDGASDIVLPLGGVFHVLESTAADQDVLVAVSGGRNAHEPDEPAHVPTLSLAYGHLIDASITEALAADDPAREDYLYLSRAESADDCAYPRRCAVGSRRVVSSPQHPTERFRYDALERLTCAYFSPAPDPSAPCAASYDYAPNGNLTFKSDVGTLSYTDPAHPHAVTEAGAETFGHDAAGNQTSRPAGVTVTYTPFDLPRTVTQAAGTVTFGYDGDQRRIRKTTSSEETLYFGPWYERVTGQDGTTAHRYFVRSPERVVAIVTRGGATPGTVYVHADHLGSVGVLTNEDGEVVERRSYDAFGQRRNPVWGEPPPASFASLTSLGFTGHEGDGELGLVNMKGRVFDPRIGRFLTTDPLIADLTFGQSLNAYSYVLNNPLTFTDPSGFSGEPEREPVLPDSVKMTTGPDGTIYVELHYPGGKRPAPDRREDEAPQVGVTAPPTDVDTTGSSAEPDPQAVTTSPEGWRENRFVQLGGGFFSGLLLGVVPFGGVGHQILDETDTIAHGTPTMRTGLAVGMIVGGLYNVFTGASGEVAGGAATVTGVGAPVGVPAMVVSTTLVVGGAANVAAGLRGLGQVMMAEGPRSGSQAVTVPQKGAAGGERAGMDFTQSGKAKVRADNRAANNGELTCENCGRNDLVDPQRAQGGQPRPPNEAQVDHIIPKSGGGDGSPPNGQVLCPACNAEKGTK